MKRFVYGSLNMLRRDRQTKRRLDKISVGSVLFAL